MRGVGRKRAGLCCRGSSSAKPFSLRPELGTLHRVVREDIRTLYAAAEDGFAGARLPEFVPQEFAGYLNCGLLCRGFEALGCEDCGEHMVVA